MAYNTPILIITFNRPDHVRRVLTEVRKQQPTQLYIAQDGPREGNESDIAKCQEVRAVVKELIDWSCDLHTNYQKKNLGCGPGPYTAMSWFFENVEFGIIIEDDVLPHPLFFPYMAELLERYKDDKRVGMVTAHNLQRYYSRKNSYYFTPEMAGTYGWGTWRRVWTSFDFNIQFECAQLEKTLQGHHMPPLCIKQFCAAYQKWLNAPTRQDFWDYQFDYYLLVKGYLNARANSCLTSHEGFDADATHLTALGNANYLMEVDEKRFMPIMHPKKVAIDSYVHWRMFKKEIHILLKKMLGKK